MVGDKMRLKKNINKDKTPEQLKQQGELLKKFALCLEDHNIIPILSDGVVLGIRREGDFIKWDFDTDFFVEYKDLKGKERSILEHMMKKGCKKYDLKTKKGYAKIAVVSDNFKVELTSWMEGEEDFYRFSSKKDKKYYYSMPKKFFKDLQMVDFYGHTYYIPFWTEDYLDFVYQDWRTPIRSKKHKEYLSGEFKKEYL